MRERDYTEGVGSRQGECMDRTKIERLPNTEWSVNLSPNKIIILKEDRLKGQLKLGGVVSARTALRSRRRPKPERDAKLTQVGRRNGSGCFPSGGGTRTGATWGPSFDVRGEMYNEPEGKGENSWGWVRDLISG